MKIQIYCKSQQENETNEIKVSADSLFAITSLKKRPDFIVESSFTIKKISLTVEGKKINLDDLSHSSGAIDVEAKVPESDRSEGGPGFFSHHHFIEINRGQ